MKSSHLALALSVSLAASAGVEAAVKTDGTMENGTQRTLTGPNYTVLSTYGQKRDRNLFHSFESLSIAKGESLTFTSLPTEEISNIISRVTGGYASSIDGQISSSIAGANLYLMNPSGIIFGPNATLDVSGSFTATTAHYIRLGTSGTFQSLIPFLPASVLTADPPSAFGFLINPAPITVTDSSLNTEKGTLSLIGGDIAVRNDSRSTGSVLWGASGVNLVSVLSGEATVSGARISTSEVTGRGRITVSWMPHHYDIRDPDIATSGARIFISAGSFIVDGASVSSNKSGEDDAGNIGITAQTVVINSGGINAATRGYGRNGGNITLISDDMTIHNAGIASGSLTGRGGNIEINSTNSVTVRGTITTTTPGDWGGGGVAGNLRIKTGFLTINSNGDIDTGTNEGSQRRNGAITLIGSNGVLIDGGHIRAGSGGTEVGGDISIYSGRAVTIKNGAVVETGTYARGDAGNIFVRAADLLMDNGGITASTSDFGNAGDIRIDVSRLKMTNGASISSSTKWIATADAPGTGKGGSINIRAGEYMSLSGSTVDVSTQAPGDGGRMAIATPSLSLLKNARISSTSGKPVFVDSGSGKGGDIVVEADHLTLQSGGSIDSSTAGFGNAGNITVKGLGTLNAADMLMTTSAKIAASTTNAGNAGNIKVNVGTLKMTGGASIEGGARTGASGAVTGKGGSIEINAGESIALTGGAIATDTAGTKQAGNISVTVPSMTISGGGSISAKSSGTGDAGSISVSIGDKLSMAGGTITTEATDSGGGKTASHILIAANDIDMSGSSEITSKTKGHDAGAITVSSPVVVVEGGSIIGAETLGDGKGGDVKLTTASLTLKSGGRISATSSHTGDAGSISVTTRDTLILKGGTITTEATDSGTGGTASTISISANDMHMSGGSEITSKTNGHDAGTIKVTSPTVVVDGSKISADTSGTGRGGAIAVKTDALSLKSGGSINSSTSGLGDAGSITINRAGTFSTAKVNMASAGKIEASTTSQGRAGNVKIDVDSLKVTGGASIQGLAKKSEDGKSVTGNGGSIEIRAAESVTLSNGSIATDTAGSGAAGSISVTAPSMAMAADGSISATSSSTGDAGSISVSIGNKLSMNGGTITTAATGSGEGTTASRISITAKDIDMAGGSEITSKTNGHDAGTISVTSPAVVIREGSKIGAETSGPGKGGEVTVTTGSLTLADGGSQIGAETSGAGNGGEISITTNSLTVADGGSISATSSSTGDAGSISVSVRNKLSMNGGTITTAATDSGKGESESRISITANDMYLSGGSRITSKTKGHDAGSITVVAPYIVLNGGSQIGAETSGAGKGGEITVTTRSLTLADGGSISATSSDTGTAGAITLHVVDQLMMDHGSITTAASQATGGNITIDPIFAYLRDSSITTSVNGGLGNGGNISFAADNIVLQRSTITANAIGGNGGSVGVTADVFIADTESILSASSQLGLPGTVNINAPLIDVSGTLVSLPEGVLTDDLTPATCAATGRSSSFTVAAPPLQYRPDRYLLAF